MRDFGAAEKIRFSEAPFLVGGCVFFIWCVCKLSFEKEQHMDVLINWLVVKFDEEIRAASRDWSVLEMWCWSGLTQNNFKRCEDDLMPYVRDFYLLNRGRAWHMMERLYGFGYVIEDHWVGFEVSA